MAKHQSLALDAVGPLTYILETAAKGELTQKAAMEAAQTALKLLGNASMHANRDRRKAALQSMNARLTDMAEDDAIYKSAAPALFGEGFCKKAKERDDELKCLNQAMPSSAKPSSTHTRGSTLFRGGRSYKSHASRGTGQDYRGRRGGYQRSHPYQYNGRGNWNRKDDQKKNS